MPEQNGAPGSPASPLSEPPSRSSLEELPGSPFSQSREAASSVGEHSQSSTPASLTPPPPHLSIRHTHTRHAALLEGEGAWRPLPRAAARRPACRPPPASRGQLSGCPLLFTGDPVTDGELLHVPTMRHLLQPM